MRDSALQRSVQRDLVGGESLGYRALDLGSLGMLLESGLIQPGDRGPVVVNRNGEEKTLEVTYDAAEHGR